MNYLDWVLQDAKSTVALLREYELPIWVMEPVRGGALANLSQDDAEMLEELRPGASAASWAFRWLQGFVSGMSTAEQLEDNLKTFEHFQPVDEMEHKLLEEIAAQLLSVPTIQCTACRYCCKGCPKKIEIPEIFKAVNMLVTFGEHIRPHLYYDNIRAMGSARARDCIACGQCEGVCPQHLPIIELLRDASQRLDK